MSGSILKRICLDTNVYIIGTQDPDSDEAQILQAIGYYGKEQIQLEAEIILSPELIDQIRRVGKYLWNKDKVGFVLGIIWSRLNIFYLFWQKTPTSRGGMNASEVTRENLDFAHIA
ncbi:MAG: hypothetical protein ACRC2S_27585 [Waterburya sp.]